VLAVVDALGGQPQPGPLVQDGVEAGEESHVDDEDGDDPDDEDDDDFDDGQAAGLPLAGAPRAEGVRFGVGLESILRKNVSAENAS
jgi:hypothetical protein